MLVERSKLTSGSTWHAAGGFHTLNGDTNMAALQGYTIRLYKELEEITGMSCRMGGAVIETNCMVLHTNQRPEGTWDVVTSKGTIHAEHQVNAGGLWAREVAAMAGVYLPSHPIEHQYLVAEDLADIYNRASEYLHVMDPVGESYLRQESYGLYIGFYEQLCKPWAVDGTPWDFGHELLPDNLYKMEDSIASAFYRIPVLEHAGIKSVIHGPFTFAPDGNPLVGPVPRVRNDWSAGGVMAGFSQGGGMGLMLAQWIIHGECECDVTAIDVARFGSWDNAGYTRSKVVENYQRRFFVSYPHEELPAARPHRTPPMYDTFTKIDAVWGQQFGLEVENYFAQACDPIYENPTFRRSHAFAATAREVANVRSGVGINEVHNFGKFEVTGPHARAWFDWHLGSWLSEFSPDYTAAETGVDRFIDFHKTTDFIGRHAANAERDTPPDRVLATFEVDADDADVVAYEPVFIVGAVQGFCTSGGYSHHLGKSIAMALIPRAHAVHGVQAKIEIMGQLRAANMVTTSGFDPDMQKMWS